MGFFKNVVKGIGNVAGDIAKLAVQPIATAVNSVAGKEKIDLNYSTGAAKAIAKVNTTVDRSVNTAFKGFADGISGGLATKAVNKIRSADAQEVAGNYYDAQTLGKAGNAIASIGAAYGQKQAAKAVPKTIAASPNANPIPLSASVSSVSTAPTNMSLFSALGTFATNVAKEGIKGVIKNATTQTANPAQSAAGIAAPATTVGPFVGVNQQTTGSGVFSQVQGFMGGGNLQKSGTVIPKVASGIAAYSGGGLVDLGGGYSINVPSNGTNLPSNQSQTLPTWAMPVIWIVGGLVAIVVLFKALKK